MLVWLGIASGGLARRWGGGRDRFRGPKLGGKGGMSAGVVR